MKLRDSFQGAEFFDGRDPADAMRILMHMSLEDQLAIGDLVRTDITDADLAVRLGCTSEMATVVRGAYVP